MCLCLLLDRLGLSPVLLGSDSAQPSCCTVLLLFSVQPRHCLCVKLIEASRACCTTRHMSCPPPSPPLIPPCPVQGPFVNCGLEIGHGRAARQTSRPLAPELLKQGCSAHPPPTPSLPSCTIAPPKSRAAAISASHTHAEMSARVVSKAADKGTLVAPKKVIDAVREATGASDEIIQLVLQVGPACPCTAAAPGRWGSRAAGPGSVGAASQADARSGRRGRGAAMPSVTSS